jgi:uncharacterized membrane protein YoaK (UPF0700 family)
MPPAKPPAPRAVVLALVALTFTTGLVDAVSFLGLGRVFCANMTGNVVLLGFGLAGSDGLPVLAPLASLGAFVLGAALAGALLRRRAASGPPGPLDLARALAVEGVLAAAATVILIVDPGLAAGTFTAGVVIALLASSMGIRNAVVRKLAVPELTTTVLTMTVTGLAADGTTAAPGAHGRRLAAVAAMLLGALVGALFVKSTLWPPLALTAATAAALAVWLRVTFAR